MTVEYRRWKSTGNIVAFIPDMPINSFGTKYCVGFDATGKKIPVDAVHTMACTVPVSNLDKMKLRRLIIEKNPDSRNLV